VVGAQEPSLKGQEPLISDVQSNPNLGVNSMNDTICTQNDTYSGVIYARSGDGVGREGPTQ
jgi:hypothetical protein